MPRGACGSEDLLGASGTVPDRIQCACAGFEGVRQRDSVVMVNEQCSECGFDGNTWTDETALEAVDCLPDRWAAAVANLAPEDVGRRPIAGMWSIAEYTDHVRETTFGMRFVLDIAIDSPGTELGDPPPSRFDPEPRSIDAKESLTNFRSEIAELTTRLRSLHADHWANWCGVGPDHVDAHWIVRHALHDVSHHLGDIGRLRRALDHSTTD